MLALPCAVQLLHRLYAHEIALLFVRSDARVHELDLVRHLARTAVIGAEHRHAAARKVVAAVLIVVPLTIWIVVAIKKIDPTLIEITGEILVGE